MTSKQNLVTMEPKNLVLERDPTCRDDFDGSDFRPLGPPVDESSQGERVDGYLAKRFPFLSRAGWQKRIRQGELRVNHRATRPSSRLKQGDFLSYYHPGRAEPEVERDIRVLWQRDGVMAVYKPGNLPMHEVGPYRKNTFAHILAEEIGSEWAAVHRLDRETSGIVLCASNLELRGQLALGLAQRRTKKEYLAIVRGQPMQEVWSVDGAIDDLKESAIRIKKWVVEGGLPARTDFQVLDRGRDLCLLKAFPLTGRTNQIRIHLAYSGHVILGDKLYHPDEGVFLEYFEKGPTARVLQKAGFRRHLLHAAALMFVHPRDGRWERVECPMPADMAEAWSQETGWRCASYVGKKNTEIRGVESPA